MKKTFALVLLAACLSYNNIYAWESQLFPFNGGSGKYQEATVSYNGRNWKLLDYSYTGYNLGETGLRNNIPCTTINITGSGDITSQIQSAVDTLEVSGGGRVVIPAGNFTISSRITINRKNISIEGAGSGNTVLNVPSSIVLLEGANDFQGVFTFEYTADGWNKGWPDRGTVLSGITQPIAEGATYLTGVTNLAGIAAGDWIVIQQYWWQTFSQQNSSGVWQYYPANTNRETTFTYLRKVVSKDALGFTVDAPIPFNLDPANNPITIRRSGPNTTSYQMLENVGLSGVSIVFADNNSGTDSRPRGAGVVMESVVNGWCYDVHIHNYPRHGFYFEYDARLSFVNCLAKKTQDYGGDGYGYAYHNYASQNVLIKDCYAEDVRHAYIFQKPLANYCAIVNSDSIDCRQGEDTHHSFSHAILRDNVRHSHGNKMVGYNRGTTSTNAYETYGTGVNWNVTGDGIGGVWESAIFSMNPAPYPSPYTHGIMVGGPGLYRVFDNGSHISGTYVEGDQIMPSAGLQVGPNGDKNMLYEGIGQAGLSPASLYVTQLSNRLGTIPAVWDSTCGAGVTLPMPTATPALSGELIFDSEHAAWGSNFGSACPLPLNTLTPGTNLDDKGQVHGGIEALRVDVTAGSNWTPMFIFGGPDLTASDYTNIEFWIYPTNTAMQCYVNLMNDDAGTTLGSTVTLSGSYAAGGAFTANTWNKVTIPLTAFSYAGTFSGIRFARTASAPGTFYIDDMYLMGGAPTATPTDTNTPASTATNTHTNTYTPTYTSTATVPNTSTHTSTATFTFTPVNTSTNTGTATNTPVNTSTSTNSATRTYTQTQTFTYTESYTPSETVTVGGPTLTFTNTFTYTYTATATYSATNTNTAVNTATPTNSPVNTATPTNSPVNTATSTVPPINTATYTNTVAETATHTYTNTRTYTFTHTQTPVLPTNTQTRTNTATATMTGTYTFTPVFTNTFTPTFTYTFTITYTHTHTHTYTATIVPTFTHTPTPTDTAIPSDAKEQEIKDVTLYPHPYDGKNGNLKIMYTLKKRASSVKLRIYSSAFRLIREDEIGKSVYAGTHIGEIKAAKLSVLANGTYYFVVTDSGGARSKADKLILIK